MVIEGPKACGKTAMARQAAASEVLLDVDEEARAAVGINPALVIEGPTPRLIDEWQVEPLIWNQVRRAVDDRGEPGQFILAGSATPADDITRHSGAGRFARLRLRTMSLFEMGASNGAIPLANILVGQKGEATNPGLSFADLTEEITRGGWPGLRKLPIEVARQRVRTIWRRSAVPMSAR